jgi:hypothetical protein
VVTSSAVVGSSAISSLRVQRDGHGDADALALAAGQLVRIARRAGNGILGQTDPVEHLAGDGERLAARPAIVDA